MPGRLEARLLQQVVRHVAAATDADEDEPVQRIDAVVEHLAQRSALVAGVHSADYLLNPHNRPGDSHVADSESRAFLHSYAIKSAQPSRL